MDREPNKKWKQWDGHCQLVAEETSLIQQLAAAQWEEQYTRDFVVSDQVVIKNPNLTQVGGILNLAGWWGVVTSVTPFCIYFQGDPGYKMHHIQ